MRTLILHRLTLAGTLLAIAACGDSLTDPDLVTDPVTDSVADPVTDSVPEDPPFPTVMAVAVVDSSGPIFRSLNVELDVDGGEVRAIDSFGVLGPAQDGQFQTGMLPPDLVDFQFQVAGSATFPLLMLSSRAGPTSHTIMIDSDGYIVWYRPDNAGLSGFSRLSNGDFVFNTRGKLEVVTPANKVVAALDGLEGAARAGRDEFNIHHDVITTPSNTVLFLVLGRGWVNRCVNGSGCDLPLIG